MTTNVKLFNINQVGTVLAVIQKETATEIVVNDPLQLGTDEKGELMMMDYLNYTAVISMPKGVVFQKSNIISTSIPVKELAELYVQATKEEQDDTPKLIVPDNKIITR